MKTHRILPLFVLLLGLTPASAGVLTYTSTDGADTTSSFAVQSSGTVDGSYTDVSPAAVITQLPSGMYQTTVAKSGSAQFYRIRKR